MMTMLPGMLTIVVLWILLYAVFTGIGLLVLRLCRIRELTAELVMSGFWLGYGVIIGVLQIWHLLLPVNIYALVMVCGLGVMGLSLHATSLWTVAAGCFGNSLWKKWLFWSGLVIVGGVLCFAVWLANRAMGPIEPYDAGLYHLGSIKWVSSYRIVPGLGNLQHRFSNITTYFLYHSFLDAILWQGRSYNLGAGLLLMGTIVQIAVSAWRIISMRDVSVMDLMRILYLAPVVRFCFNSTSSTSPDLPIFLLGVIISVELARILFRGQPPLPAPDCANRSTQDVARSEQFAKNNPLPGGAGVGFSSCLIVFLSCIGVTTKLSFVVMGVLASSTALLYYLVKEGKLVSKPMAAAILTTLVLLCPWCARNVILSGYPAYHSTAFKVDVAWRVPEKVAKYESDLVRSHARNPKADYKEVLADWDWFKPWIVGALGYWFLEMDVPLAMAAIGALILLYRAVNSRRNRARHLRISKVRSLWSVVCSLLRPVGMGIPDWGKSAVYLLIPLLSLVFWLWAAPAPRFAGAAFWWFGGGALVLAFLPPIGRPISGGLVGCVLALSLVLTSTFHFKADKFVSPGSERGFHPVPRVEMNRYTTIHGLDTLVPVAGDQCWDAPLPCTPYPNAGLRLRFEGGPSSGFLIEPPDTKKSETVHE